MVWQHDKVNRLMDHRTNAGEERQKRKEEKKGMPACRQQKIGSQIA